MIVIGIDPGITGAIAVVGDIAHVEDMPVMAASKGKNQINPYALSYIIGEYAPDNVVIERVSAMPGQGVSSMFNFGKSAGIIEGVCAALAVKVEFVTPQAWKKKAGMIGKDKDYSRTMAIQKYPEFASSLTRKKDCGRADAIHIAMHGLEH